MREFDRKFGPDFLATVPLEPGIYRYFDKQGALIYVGKAIRLRRRLQQYRNASRMRRHRKMRKILKEGVRLEYEVCTSHREACLRELELIQQLRPRLNVSAAYSFLYPLVGVRYDAGSARLELVLASSTEGVATPTRWHGCYRSRAWTREFFWTLGELLEFSAHRVREAPPKSREPRVTQMAFRQVDPAWVAGFNEFLEGGPAREFLAEWILKLVDNAGARARSGWVQERLKILTAFHRQECQRLREARELSGFAAYPVAQEMRDRIFLEARLRREGHSNKGASPSGPSRMDRVLES